MSHELIEAYRLSRQQHQRWHGQRRSAPNAIDSAVTCLVEGPLDRRRLERGLLRLINRHDILRTSYRLSDGLPLQVIEPPLLSFAPRESDTAGSPFSAATGNGSALDITLLTVGDDRHVLTIACPAAIGDIETLRIILGELSVDYAAGDDASSTQVADQTNDAIQYLQYAEYQHEWLDGDEARDLQRRWATLSRGALPPALSGMRRSGSQPFAVESEPIRLASATLSALREICGRAGASLDTGLFALWQVLIARFAGQSSYQLRFEVGGRTFDDIVQLPGPFARSVPYDAEIELGTTFATVLGAAHRQTTSIREWQDGYLVHDDPDNDDAAVAFSAVRVDGVSEAGPCRFVVQRARGGDRPFALRLACVEIGEGVDLAIDYDVNRFEPGAAQQLARSFEVLAEAVGRDPETTVGAAPLLSAEARERIVGAWNATFAKPPYAPEPTGEPTLPGHWVPTGEPALAVARGRSGGSEASPFVLDRIEAWCGQDAQAIALRALDRQMTRGELRVLVAALGGRLRSLGARPEAVVAIVAEPSIDAVVAILATLEAGAAFLPIDPATPDDRIAFMLRDANAIAVLTDRPLPASWREPTVLPLGDAAASTPGRSTAASTVTDVLSGDERGVELQPANAAYVIYTSGSTGTPKGVVVEHRGLTHYLDWCGHAYAQDGAAGAPLHSSLAFDLTITSLFGPLAAGQTVVLPAPTGRVDALADLLREHRDFSWVKLTPGHARLIGERLGAEQLRGRTRTLIVGGEALTESDLIAWRTGAPETRIVNEYGPTEGVVGCAVHTLSDGAEDPVPIGRPIRGARLYVLDEQRGPVPPGVTGELFIGGAALARGYAGRPDLTADRFIPDPHGEPGARMYRTGDLARYRDDGVLMFLGRRDDQVKLRGYRVELGEIEAVLTQHPEVHAAAVVVHEAQPDVSRLVAYLSLSGGGDADQQVSVARAVGDGSSDPGRLTISDLREFLTARLPEYMVPAMFVVLPALPLTRNGKIDRRALPEPDALHGARAYAGPRTLEEEVLAEIWARVLGVARVGIDEDYFMLGGDSIRAIQVVGLAAERGLNLSIETLFRHRTVRALARALQSHAGKSSGRPGGEPFSLIDQIAREALPKDVIDAYPLSALQAGMIFHREYHPESAIYHDIFGYHLRMPLDVAKLEQAVRALVERHPALRTAVHLDGFHEPLQLVHRAAPLPLAIDDISHLSYEEQQRTLIAWMEAEKKRGFAEHERPMLRFHVHIRDAESFEFSLSFHHAVLDGWSDANMLLELAVSYQALLDGRPIPFEAPRTTYREFIALERQTMASEEARHFWAGRLAGARPLLLPRWNDVPAEVTGPRGVTLQRVPISRETSDALRQIARSLALPFKSVLLAAHMRVMSVLGGTTDVVSSLSVAGRPETLDASQVLGLHINSTPMRLTLTGGTWTELAHAAFQEERDALPFRRYPLAEIQRLAGVRRLVETSFYYTHYHNVEPLAHLPQFEILGRLAYEETSFAMVANFNLDPFDGLLGLTLACDQTQFDTAQRQWLGDYYDRALRALAADPGARYDAVALMSDEEYARIAVLTRNGAASSSTTSAAPIELVHHMIARQASESSSRIAVKCDDRLLTYAELDEQASRLASHLTHLGAGPDRIVGLCAPRSVELIVGMLAILKSGAAYLPLDPEYPRERLAFMVGDARPCLVVATIESLSIADTLGAPTVNVERELQTRGGDTSTSGPMATDAAAGETREEVAAAALEPGHAAYVIYTSGSTGRPKGAVISHGNLVQSTAARRGYYRDPIDAYLLLSSYAFDSSVAGVFWTLTTGGTLVIPQGETYRDPNAIVDTIERHGISHVLSLPSVHAGVLEATSSGQLSTLRVAIVAGESCPPRLVARHRERLPAVRLFNEYGPTEATVWSTVEECGHVAPNGAIARDAVASEAVSIVAASIGTVSIGRPIPGASTYVLDAHFQPAPLGVAGELFVGGPGVARGYLGRPDLTAEWFLPDPWSPEPGARMYRTGDAVRLPPHGRIEFLGRLDRQVKIRGHRVEIGEIEALLRADPLIADAAVVTMGEGAAELSLVAFVVASAKPGPGHAQMREGLRRRLPEYMVPARIVVLDVLPTLPNGKLDRRALATLDPGDDDGRDRYVAPEDEVQRTLASIWAQVLKVERVGVEDDFFALGGDSILSIQIVARAKAAGLRVLPADLFRGRTIAALAPLAQRLPAFDSAAPAEDGRAVAAGVIAVGLGDQQALQAIERLANRVGAGGGAPGGTQQP